MGLIRAVGYFNIPRDKVFDTIHAVQRSGGLIDDIDHSPKPGGATVISLSSPPFSRNRFNLQVEDWATGLLRGQDIDPTPNPYTVWEFLGSVDEPPYAVQGPVAYPECARCGEPLKGEIAEVADGVVHQPCMKPGEQVS